MKKTKILIPALAVLALGMAASVTGTVAWYTADSNAKINVNTASGNIGSTTSTITAGVYSVNFNVAPAVANLELTHVVTSAEASAGLNGAGTLTAGDMVYGVISNGTATMRKITGTLGTNYVTTLNITATWASAPTDPADVAYLKGKKFSISLTSSGHAHFLNGGTASSGQSNAEAATAVVHIDNSLNLTVDTISPAYVHIEPESLSATETGTGGSVAVTAATNIAPEVDA